MLWHIAFLLHIHICIHTCMSYNNLYQYINDRCEHTICNWLSYLVSWDILYIALWFALSEWKICTCTLHYEYIMYMYFHVRNEWVDELVEGDNKWVIEWVSEWILESEWVDVVSMWFGLVSDHWMSKWFVEKMSGWVNELVEWVNWRMNEWLSLCLSKGVGEYSYWNVCSCVIESIILMQMPECYLFIQNMHLLLYEKPAVTSRCVMSRNSIKQCVNSLIVTWN